MNIFIGNVPSVSQLTPVTSLTNATITSTGSGKVYIGKNGIQPDTPINTLNALGRNILFNTGNLPTSSIEVGGSVTITADPPPGAAAGGTATIPTMFGENNASQSAQIQLNQTAPSVTTAMATSAAFPASFASASVSKPASALQPSLANTSLMGVNVSSALNEYSSPNAGNAQSLTNLLNAGSVANAGTMANAASVVNAGTMVNAGLMPNARNMLNAGDVTEANSRKLFGAIWKSKPVSKPGITSGYVREAVDNKQLLRGALMLAPERNTVVHTPFGMVEAGRKSLTLLIVHEHGLSVFDFDDTHQGSVSVLVAGEKIKLAPGHHVTITGKEVDRFEYVNPAKFIAYRNTIARKHGTDRKSFSSEFHIQSAITGLQPLRTLISARENGGKKVGDHLLKTVAILSALFCNNEPYQLMVEPEITAMSR